MWKIICLMGKSASGKDTIYKRLLETDGLGLKVKIPYTTRPMRASELQGREYNFVTEEEYLKLKESGRIVEERSYNTVQGLWRYFNVVDPEEIGEDDRILVIGTLETYNSLCRTLGKEHILPIYIETDDGERLERALRRERRQDVPGYTEMCRRFIADAEDFSDEKLVAAGIDRRFANTNLEECLQEIISHLADTFRI